MFFQTPLILIEFITSQLKMHIFDKMNYYN